MLKDELAKILFKTYWKALVIPPFRDISKIQAELFLQELDKLNLTITEK